MQICIRIDIVSGEWIVNVFKGSNSISIIANWSVNVLALTEGRVIIYSLDQGIISSREGAHISGQVKRK